jgi:uncharacterized delta-60 repeat protein
MVCCAPVGAQPAGTLDSTFGDGGIVLARPAGFQSAFASALGVDTEGRIVAVGTLEGSFAALRLRPDGSIDTDFGSGGWALVNFGSSRSYARGMTIQDDGRILMVGQVEPVGTSRLDYGVARLTADGAIDVSFGNNGRITYAFTETSEHARAVAVHPNGRILVAGFAEGGAGVTFGLFRLTASGALDASFSGDGFATISFPGCGDWAMAVDVMADGRAVVAGGREPNCFGRYDFAVARILYSGALDGSFGGDGRVEVDFPGGVFPDRHDSANGVLVYDDGRILLVGVSGQQGPGDGGVALARLLQNGALDPSFSGDGRVILDETQGEGVAAVVQPDGRVVVASSAYAIYRINADGSTDDSFGEGGRVIVNFDVEDRGSGIALQSDGRPVLAGYAGPDGIPESRIAVARLLGDPGTATAPDPVRPGLSLSVSPNPSGGAVVGRLRLPRQTRARVVVYDQLGRELAVAFDEFAGPGEIVFGISALPPGSYLIRALAGGSSVVRPLVVAR